MEHVVSALWWAGELSRLAAKRGEPKLNALARRFQAEFQRLRVELNLQMAEEAASRRAVPAE